MIGGDLFPKLILSIYPSSGEFNSVSCSGRDNVSNTFGQAMWLVCHFILQILRKLTGTSSLIRHSTQPPLMFHGKHMDHLATHGCRSIVMDSVYVHQGGPLALQSSTQLNHGGLSFYNLWSASEQFERLHVLIPRVGTPLTTLTDLFKCSRRILHTYLSRSSLVARPHFGPPTSFRADKPMDPPSPPRMVTLLQVNSQRTVIGIT